MIGGHTMPETARTFNLEVFRNTCFDCGHEFETVADPRAYGWVQYVSDKGELRFIDADSDPVWKEASALTEEVIGRKIVDVEEADIFHELLVLTFDPPSPGDTIRDQDRQPCPKCGSTKRMAFGPYSPTRTRFVTIAAVTHERWSKLSRDEKRKLFEEYLAERKAARADKLPVTIAALQAALGLTRDLRAQTPDPSFEVLETIL